MAIHQPERTQQRGTTFLFRASKDGSWLWLQRAAGDACQGILGAALSHNFLQRRPQLRDFGVALAQPIGKHPPLLVGHRSGTAQPV